MAVQAEAALGDDEQTPDGEVAAGDDGKGPAAGSRGAACAGAGRVTAPVGCSVRLRGWRSGGCDVRGLWPGGRDGDSGLVGLGVARVDFAPVGLGSWAE